MKCNPHLWERIPPRAEDHGTYVDTVQVAGQQCHSCPKVRGRQRGIVSRRSRNKAPLLGEVPRWLADAAEGLVWNARLPASLDRVRDIDVLVRQGVVDADFKAHEKTGKLVVHRVYLGASPAESRLVQIRRALTQQVPEAAAWLSRARLDELETAQRIVAVRDFRTRRWPARVWNAAVREFSKQGDASRIARELGCDIVERASTHEIWFYGRGILQAGDRTIHVDGEAVLPEAWLRGSVRIDAGELAVVENRDVASLAPGLVMALDGQCTPTQQNVLRQMHQQATPAWFWPDVDGAGVTMARLLRRAHPQLRVVGLHEWPREWTQKQEPTQLLQALDAAKMVDEWSPILDYVMNVGWVEQERIYAELDQRGDPWKLLLFPPSAPIV